MTAASTSGPASPDTKLHSSKVDFVTRVPALAAVVRIDRLLRDRVEADRHRV